MLLWRNAIQLFHIYPKLSFFGPFAQAGIRDYVIEVKLSYRNSTKEGDPDAGKMFDPDICASGESGWFILELTTNPKAKGKTLEKYRHLDCKSLDIYDIPAAHGSPDVMSGRLEYVDDSGFCQLILLDQLEVKKVENIKNDLLRNCLISANGTPLSKLPELPIAFVPESVKDKTGVRVGLLNIVMRLFAPNCAGMTAGEMADAGLERLAKKVDPGKRNVLINKIESEMKTLIGKHMGDYLELKEDGKYAPTQKYTGTPNQRSAIAVRMRSWALSEQVPLDYNFKSKTDPTNGSTDDSKEKDIPE
jgi:hypothetical protein